MKVKEQIKTIMKEHKFLKEQLIGNIVAKADSIDDTQFATTAEQIFGIAMNKADFKKKIAKGEMTIEKLQEFDEACQDNPDTVTEEVINNPEEELPEDNLEEGEGSEEDDETMKTKQESDGAPGEHKDPDATTEAPVSPAAAGDGVTGDTKTDEMKPNTPEQGAGASDGSEGDHKTEGTDELDDDKTKLEQLEEDQDELKEAIEGDLMSLLQDLIGKVHELESKIMTQNGGEDGMEDNTEEPQPPVTQEGIHGAKPLSKNKTENVDIARSVGKSFFNTRSKR